VSLPDFVRKHVTVAALLGTAVAGVTACGTGTGNSASGTGSAVSRSSPRPTDPLAGLTGGQILTRALNDLKAASSVHYMGPRTTIAGQPVQELEKPNERGAGYVSVSARPELVRLWDPSSNGGTLNFSSFNQPVRIVAPPASETVDGAQYGR